MQLEKLFNPRSVAFVGVSARADSFQIGGRAVFEHLRRHGYPHDIALVRKDAGLVDGIKSVARVSELAEPPECMVVAVRAQDVQATVEEGLALGTRAFVVISGGFAESGEVGRVRQQQLVEVVSSHGAALLGPNTTGYVNVPKKVALSSTTRISSGLPPAGRIGVVIQSGAIGSVILEDAIRYQIGLSLLVSTGNEAVTDLADCIEFLVADAETSCIAAYVESFRSFERVVAAARRAYNARKPILVYKAGRSEAGQHAAAGHTGSLVGARGAYDAAVRQLGWVDVRNVEDLLPVADYLARFPVPSKAFAILTNSGGLGGCVADALNETGRISLPAPAPATIERLRAEVPSFLSIANPIDLGGVPFRRAGSFETCLVAVAADPNYDGIVLANTPIAATWADQLVSAAVLVHERQGKPIAAVWPSLTFNADEIATLRRSGVPVFGRVETFACAAAGARMVADAQQRTSRLVREGATRFDAFGADQIGLDEARSKAILRGLGLTFPPETFVPGKDIGAAVEAARAIGFPVVLKGIVTGVVHKSDLGLVQVGLGDSDSLAKAATGMLATAPSQGLPWTGFLVAQSVIPRAEIIIGLRLDPEFGPLLTFGAGGIYTEIVADATARLLPLDDREIYDMIASCKIGRILSGARAKATLDIPAVVALLKKMASLRGELGRNLGSVELNPVGVGAAGEGVWILDATVFTAANREVVS